MDILTRLLACSSFISTRAALRYVTLHFFFDKNTLLDNTSQKRRYLRITIQNRFLWELWDAGRHAAVR